MELVRLGDELNGVLVRVLGRFGAGTLQFHDHLAAEVVVATEFVSGKLDLVLAPADLQDWEHALDALAVGGGVRWLDGGRSPEVHLSGRESGSLVRVTVVDEPASGVSVTLELSVADGWIDDHRARLRAVREAWPSEVVEASPGVYEWR
ncbi:DUF5959 family protein [Amycolatopsis tucumanensis]|uniref:DUF5959 family protein n=1 Tax=Amycolatopsis tucumanensis TaxID=401106 RepID=UPI003D73B23E